MEPTAAPGGLLSSHLTDYGPTEGLAGGWRGDESRAPGWLILTALRCCTSPHNTPRGCRAAHFPSPSARSAPPGQGSGLPLSGMAWKRDTGPQNISGSADWRRSGAGPRYGAEDSEAGQRRLSSRGSDQRTVLLSRSSISESAASLFPPVRRSTGTAAVRQGSRLAAILRWRLKLAALAQRRPWVPPGRYPVFSAGRAAGLPVQAPGS